MTDIPIPADPRDVYAKAAFRKAQSVYRGDYDHFPMTHTWETTDEAVREGWRAIAFAAVEAHADHTSDADLQDVIHEALADSMDMDWSCDVGAKAVVKVLAADRAVQAERMARLEEALKPFAEVGAEIDRLYPDYADHIRLFYGLTHGDFHRAARALSQEGSDA